MCWDLNNPSKIRTSKSCSFEELVIIIDFLIIAMCTIYWSFCNKYHRLGGLNNRNLFLHCSGGQKSKIKVLVWLISSDDSLLGSQMVLVSLFLFMVIPLHVSVSSSPHKDTSHSGSETTPVTPFNLNYLSKGPTSKQSHILRQQGLGLQYTNLGEKQLTP